MEVRNLIKSGQSSLIVSLPQAWIHHNKLKKGDKLFLNTTENKIIIQPFPELKFDSKQEFFIEYNKTTEKYLEELLHAAFLSDVQSIIIKRFDKAELNRILVILKKIPFLKVSSMKPDSIILSFLTDSSQNLLENEITHAVFLFENFFETLVNDTSDLSYLTEVYRQCRTHVLLLMKNIKTNFLLYQKTELLRYNQQIDTFYFFLKICKEFLSYSKITSVDMNLKKFLFTGVGYLKNAVAAQNKGCLKETLQIYEGLEKQRKEVLEKLVLERKPEKLRILILINNLYETIISFLFAYVNNSGKTEIS